MSRFRRPRGLTIWPMLLALLWAAACSRPANLQSGTSATPADQHQVPFHDGEGSQAATQGDSASAQDSGPNPETGLPFHDPTNLPAGTLLTVRLKSPISAQNPNTTFEAVIDEPIVIEGNKLVPRGVVVAGRVESASSSNLKRNLGYVRLALDSIHLASGNLPIQTSSLFVRGSASKLSQRQISQNQTSSSIVRLEKGRRLTFRLVEPAYVVASERTKIEQ